MLLATCHFLLLLDTDTELWSHQKQLWNIPFLYHLWSPTKGREGLVVWLMDQNMIDNFAAESVPQEFRQHEQTLSHPLTNTVAQ